MLSAYDLSTDQSKRNATFEVNQQIILAGLYQGGFFEKAAFYGGTCLRIFHGLNRFSEDMDFSLLNKDESFDFSQYFQPIIAYSRALSDPDLSPSFMGHYPIQRKGDHETHDQTEQRHLPERRPSLCLYGGFYH